MTPDPLFEGMEGKGREGEERKRWDGLGGQERKVTEGRSDKGGRT
jgi:hypothetical protein